MWILVFSGNSKSHTNANSEGHWFNGSLLIPFVLILWILFKVSLYVYLWGVGHKTKIGTSSLPCKAMAHSPQVLEWLEEVGERCVSYWCGNTDSAIFQANQVVKSRPKCRMIKPRNAQVWCKKNPENGRSGWGRRPKWIWKIPNKSTMWSVIETWSDFNATLFSNQLILIPCFNYSSHPLAFFCITLKHS